MAAWTMVQWNPEALARHPRMVHWRKSRGRFHGPQHGRDADVLEWAVQIDEQKLARWVAKAGTSIWDMVGERRAFVAKQRKAKAAKRAKTRKRAKAKK
jgi:hypothetical protein